MGHETYDRENDESGEHTGEGIDAADDDRVSEKQTRACNGLVILNNNLSYYLCVVLRVTRKPFFVGKNAWLF